MSVKAVLSGNPAMVGSNEECGGPNLLSSWTMKAGLLEKGEFLYLTDQCWSGVVIVSGP